jgi:thiamine biosynthesis lipoprotein
MSSVMHRRDFLHPKQLAGVAAQALDAALELRALEREQEQAGDALLLRFSRQAMATTFEVIFPFGTPSDQAVAEAALDEIDRLEAQLTVYRDDSEVSRLNATAANQPVVVAENLFQLLARAHHLHQQTGGAFDVAVGALVKAWGFYRRQGRAPTEEERARALAQSGMQHVRLDAQTRGVAFDRPGLEINLGSIGKGFALDQVLRLIHRRQPVHSLLLHGGHSSILAVGHEPGTRHGWSIGVLDPDDPARRLGVLRLRQRGLGTSAGTRQHFVHEGRKLGHILDPRSGWPVEGMRLATVTAPSAAEADALATAFYILGVEGARAYCETHPHIGAVLLPAGATQPVILGAARQEFDASP